MNIHEEVAAMQKMTARDLRERYAEVVGEEARSSNKLWLIRRIAWRLQAQSEGGLTERARRRAEELADETDVRVTPPRHLNPLAKSTGRRKTKVESPPDPRLPPVGTSITRKYKGRELVVHVQADGLVYDGERFKSLSAVAKAITGSHCNGYRFFNLEAK